MTKTIQIFIVIVAVVGLALFGAKASADVVMAMFIPCISPALAFESLYVPSWLLMTSN